MKIVADENIPLLKEAFSSLGEVTALPGRSITKDDLNDAEILLVRSVTQVNKSLLENTPVKFVASATIGFDHLDLEYLKKRDIPWSTAPGCNATAAAEYVVTALFHVAALRDLALKGKTAAIIGCGNVGSRVKLRLAALGINCIINDPPLQEQEPEQKFINLDEALSADIITLHVPLERSGHHPTHHLLNRHNLSRINNKSILINTSRGSVIDNAALLSHLQHTPLTTVLDVWEGEPNILPELLDACILGTPHIAGYSLDGRVRGTEMIYQACCNYLNVATSWQAESVLNKVENSVINLCELEDNHSSIQQALRHIYKIVADDQTLRNTMIQPEKQRGTAFDQLRRDYPLRREFACYTVTITPQQREFSEVLQSLGFKVRDCPIKPQPVNEFE
ncbi:MAG: 4-phosphoerythronate dehydrogenase PdxB [Thiothrix sp.]|nr:MAG: 4-phosphoerythronate dehydrogenase PdxB [Thiothrix sp.]